jgi:catechol 2,3-dioxygenase-like lactoylglutathione lyase family enzyme
MNSLAHIEINVSNLQASKDFYLKILTPLNWTMVFDCNDSVGFKGQDNTHLFLVQTIDSFIPTIFHRKNTGLNHLAFRVESKQEVEKFSHFLKSNNIVSLYTDGPKDYSKEYNMEEYYAVYFEDLDRIKLEVVFMK